MEILAVDQLESISRSLSYEDPEAVQTADLLLNKFLKYVHVLAKLETTARKESNISEINTLFYSRYYWFNQFKKRYFELYGHDEGLEQQSFSMLNDFNEQSPDQIDWHIIEQIENDSIVAGHI